MSVKIVVDCVEEDPGAPAPISRLEAQADREIAAAGTVTLRWGPGRLSGARLPLLAGAASRMRPE
jgi:hypothetical protein